MPSDTGRQFFQKPPSKSKARSTPSTYASDASASETEHTGRNPTKSKTKKQTDKVFASKPRLEHSSDERIYRKHLRDVLPRIDMGKSRTNTPRESSDSSHSRQPSSNRISRESSMESLAVDAFHSEYEDQEAGAKALPISSREKPKKPTFNVNFVIRERNFRGREAVAQEIGITPMIPSESDALEDIKNKAIRMAEEILRDSQDSQGSDTTQPKYPKGPTPETPGESRLFSPKTLRKSPGTPGKNPGTPGKNPGTPGKTPGTPVKTPGTPVKNPGKSGENPGDSGENPGDSGENPGTPGGSRGKTTPPPPPPTNPGTLFQSIPAQPYIFKTVFVNRSSPPTPISNRFSPLPMEEDNLESSDTAIRNAVRDPGRKRPRITSEEQTPSPPHTGTVPRTTQQQPPNKTRTKQNKMPPVILKGIPDNHDDFIQELKQVIRHPFHLKYAYETTTVYTTDKADHVRFTETLKQQQAEFHTFPLKEDKSYAYVLRGLGGHPDSQTLRNELTDELDLDVKNVYEMKTNGRRPLYMVIFNSNTTLKFLNENIQHVMYTRVSWERRLNNRIITQCRRCQKWGHSQTNCYNKPKCVKCAEEHPTYTCKKPRDTPALCANCGRDHPACSLDCPVYQKRVGQLGATEAAQTVHIPSNKTQNTNNVNIVNRNKNVHKINNPVHSNKQTNIVSNYNYEFPALPAPQPITNAWEGRNRSPSPPAQARNVATSATNAETVSDPGSTSGMMNLFNALNELNSLINIREAVRALRDLKEMLEGKESAGDKFTALLTFGVEKLHTYNL